MLGLLAGPAFADDGGGGGCRSLPNWQALKNALSTAQSTSGNGGLGNNMWGVIVDPSGIVCAVAFSGANYTSQWLGSRAIAAQKANTGNSVQPWCGQRGNGDCAFYRQSFFGGAARAEACMACSIAILSAPRSPTATNTGIRAILLQRLQPLWHAARIRWSGNDRRRQRVRRGPRRD